MIQYSYHLYEVGALTLQGKSLERDSSPNIADVCDLRKLSSEMLILTELLLLTSSYVYFK